MCQFQTLQRCYLHFQVYIIRNLEDCMKFGTGISMFWLLWFAAAITGDSQQIKYCLPPMIMLLVSGSLDSLLIFSIHSSAEIFVQLGWCLFKLTIYVHFVLWEVLYYPPFTFVVNRSVFMICLYWVGVSLFLLGQLMVFIGFNSRRSILSELSSMLSSSSTSQTTNQSRV